MFLLTLPMLETGMEVEQAVFRSCRYLLRLREPSKGLPLSFNLLVITNVVFFIAINTQILKYLREPSKEDVV